MVQCWVQGSCRFVTMHDDMRPLLESRPVSLDLSDPSFNLNILISACLNEYSSQ